MKLPVLFRDRRAARQTALFALAVFFCAHAFCFFNLTYSGPSVSLNAASSANQQIEGGLFLQPVYFALRGGVASPLFTGLIAALCLAAALPMIAELLGIGSAALRLALCAALCCHPSLTALFAAQLHVADAVCLNLPLVCAAVLCWRAHRLGFLPGAALLAAAMALDVHAASFAMGLALLALLASLADGMTLRRAVLRLLHLAAMTLLATALNSIGLAVLLRIADLEACIELHAQGLAQTWLYPLSTLFAPLTYYAALNPVLRALLLLAGGWAALRLPKAGLCRRLLILAACVLLLPLAVNLPVVSASPADQLRPAYALIDAAVLMLVSRMSCRCAAPMRRTAAALIAILGVSGVIFSNQVYLKKNLEFESTLSFMTRVVDRAEDTPGYQPGLTPVAIVGTPEESIVAAHLEGFDHLTALHAASNTRAVTSSDDMVGYLWEIMGYPVNLISDYDRSLLEEQDAVRAMPAYPAEGCCAFVGDVLVIRLSP